MRGHGAERGDDPAVARPSLASLFTARRAVQARDPGAVGTGERDFVAVRRSIVGRVAKGRTVHDRAERVTAVALRALPEAGDPRRAFPPGGIRDLSRVVPSAGADDSVTTLAQRAT
jgi:hypothetical protein